jgi:hypothetical protein
MIEVFCKKKHIRKAYIFMFFDKIIYPMNYQNKNIDGHYIIKFKLN